MRFVDRFHSSVGLAKTSTTHVQTISNRIKEIQSINVDREWLHLIGNSALLVCWCTGLLTKRKSFARDWNTNKLFHEYNDIRAILIRQIFWLEKVVASYCLLVKLTCLFKWSKSNSFEVQLADLKNDGYVNAKKNFKFNPVSWRHRFTSCWRSPGELSIYQW